MGTSTALKCTLFVVLVVTYLTVPAQCCGRGSIIFEDRQYKQILIAIGHDVPENAAIVDKIKEIFTGASDWIYKLTRKQAYFGDITILVPQTWSDSKDYESVGKESYDKSDVQIEAEDTRFGHGDRPFVLHTTGCGELGHYMHITPDFLLKAAISIKNYGPLDKVIAHEWGHFRYGVYDEYPEEDLDTATHFYADNNGDVQATRCVLALTGKQINSKTKKKCKMVKGLPEPDCRFFDDEDPKKFKPQYASFMYKQFLPHIVEYCDGKSKDPLLAHNAAAPNAQNKNCGGKGVWDVLRKHPDFLNVDFLTPPPDVASTAPVFKVVRQKIKRTMLIMDVSGSMGPNYGNRIGKLQQGVSTFINNNVRDDEYLGMVIFNDTAFAVHDLTLVNQTTRPELMSSIPTLALGATSIGGGIRMALDILGKSQDGTGGATIVVITDGEENRPPFLTEVTDDVLGAGITLHSIAITDEADTKVDGLAISTGGLSFLYTNSQTSTALNDAFQTIGQIGLAPTRMAYPIESMADVVSSGAAIRGEVTVDDSLGRDTEFVFNYEKQVEVSVMSPSGIVYDKDSPECANDTKFGVYRFTFPDQGEQGVWEYNLTNTQSVDQQVAISANSRAYVEGDIPITTKVYWDKRIMELDLTNKITKQALYASVSKGYVPVLNADVQAEVERPRAPAQTVVLLDNGAGADTTKGDGIYSGYFIGFIVRGRYNVKVHVSNNPNTVMSTSHLIGIGAPHWSRRTKRESPDIPVGNLKRTTPGGSFELTNLITYANEHDPTSPIGNVKIYPPERVKDMVMTSADPETRQITLTWTAVGDQLDVGQATSYELRYAHSFEAINTNFSDQKLITDDMVVSGGNLTEPNPAGSREHYVIKVPEEGQILYVFAVVAVDEDGRVVRGPMSNVVTATLKYFHTDEEVQEMSHIFGILFGILGAIGVIAIAVVGYMTFRGVEQAKADSEEDAESKGMDNMTYAELENKYGAFDK